jgi:hypothetical protein
MPVLAVEGAVKYCPFWNVKAVHVENLRLGDLPRLFAHMHGWQEQVQAVARVFNSLTSEERVSCAILAYNYGEAAAIDYFGSMRGLPKAISGHNQYGGWGPRRYRGDVEIAIGFKEEQLHDIFEEVTPAARAASRYAMPEEANLTIHLCRKPKKPSAEMWTQLRWLVPTVAL